MKNPTLTDEEQIQTTIAAAEIIFNQLPGVVIIHNINTKKLVFLSQRGENALGLTSAVLANMDWLEYHSRFFNMEEAKEYVPKIFALIEANNNQDDVSYFQQVRFPDRDDWQWYISSTKIYLRDSSGKPLLLITVSLPLDPNHHFLAKVQRLLDENNQRRAGTDTFESLTKREKEILKLMALGKSTSEIAAALFISEKTAETHRRNIRVKLNAQSSYDIIKFAQAFNLV
jgi:DNA-binding CsgD family transcriptional regulator